MRRPDREGMILLNVLLILAVASVAVLVMVTSQDIEVQRSTRRRDAAQAGAYARAGELSAITGLRRDARRRRGQQGDGGERDHRQGGRRDDADERAGTDRDAGRGSGRHRWTITSSGHCCPLRHGFRRCGDASPAPLDLAG